MDKLAETFKGWWPLPPTKKSMAKDLGRRLFWKKGLNKPKLKPYRNEGVCVWPDSQLNWEEHNLYKKLWGQFPECCFGLVYTQRAGEIMAWESSRKPKRSCTDPELWKTWEQKRPRLGLLEAGWKLHTNWLGASLAAVAEKGLKTREETRESERSHHRQEFRGRLQLRHYRTAVTGSSSDTEKAHITIQMCS